ncbi:MAG: hypothetical protein P8173_16555, partial [Gammaproteobacteria bacterium]
MMGIENSKTNESKKTMALLLFKFFWFQKLGNQRISVKWLPQNLASIFDAKHCPRHAILPVGGRSDIV